MASLKYDIPLLDRDTWFFLWQVKMRAILTHAEWDDALDGFGGKNTTDWSDAEKRKDHKALCQTHLHLSNNILQEVLKGDHCCWTMVKVGAALYDKGSHKQDAP